MRPAEPSVLVERARAGDRGAVAKLISLVEHGGDDARAVVVASASARRQRVVGRHHRRAGRGEVDAHGPARRHDPGRRAATVGVLAVDPTSPFSGGAILGDRVRMQDHATDPGVFIRSMATRGHLGGLAVATPQAVRVLDAVGTPWILVETVGVARSKSRSRGTRTRRSSS